VIKRLSCEAIILINSRLRDCVHFVRDRELLESAVAQPFVSWGGQDLHSTLVMKAAIQLRGIAANHAFRDGNKRTGFISCVNFLSLNGVPLDAARVDRVEAGELVTDLVTHQMQAEDVALWLNDRLM
jgi:death-on-curing protein